MKTVTNGNGARAGASFELRAVSVDYGPTRALRDVNLTIDGGEAVAFVGPSGAGKTTLLRLLAASRPPSRGTVAVDGRWLSLLSPRELRRLRSQTGFIHQDLRLVANVRVVKNVLSGRLGQLSLAASLRTMLFPSQALVAQVYDLLRRVGIGEKLYQRTDSLSGGQRQRVAVARALFQEPRSLLADEPVASVDPPRARDTVSLLTELCRERGLTLCVSLHDLDLARELFPRIVGLRQGRVLFDRAPEEITRKELETLYDLATRGEKSSGLPTPAFSLAGVSGDAG